MERKMGQKMATKKLDRKPTKSDWVEIRAKMLRQEQIVVALMAAHISKEGSGDSSIEDTVDYFWHVATVITKNTKEMIESFDQPGVDFTSEDL